ncbi:Respiratory supercomplex factor 1, mitochondrial [Hondaea fermentalgiana]|uniref:Respiratory supercomplex factor 1, mitochondrial n=1 Tax=Hondaea fermentalgiana TaxID=2315210 RepID=A0A2R5GCC1_9STRA|nr:Respiratory supercomplex factor 1, mitochondrial [Hondaea fermentalgiana]|eukprot:GBG26233.1 Respiratory supercomplex factor 1, mitochondrial [Hondaea fermentalgiana]
MDDATRDKFMSKIRAEPLVPIGCVVTAVVLFGGIASFRAGNQKLSQQMMRARVLAQGGTLGALAYGAYVSAQNKKEFDDSGYQGNIGNVTPNESK